MSQSGPTAGFTPRQLRWAEAENARRKREFDAAYAAWYAERSELASMHAAVEGFGGQPTSYSVVLKRDERLLYELPHVSLVEVQRGPGHYTSGYSGFSFRVAKGIRYNIGGSRGTFVPGTEQHKITDEGSAAITTQRVIFQGSKNSREWAYSKLLGIQHDDTRPFTLMHVSNRQKVSGLVYPATEASTLRFYVALAIARFQDQQAAFSATVASQLAALDAVRPSPPSWVTPDEAPRNAVAVLKGVRTTYIGRPGWPRGWRVTQAVVTVTLTFALLGNLTSHTQTPTSSESFAPRAAPTAEYQTQALETPPPVPPTRAAVAYTQPKSGRPAAPARSIPKTSPKPRLLPNPTPSPKAVPRPKPVVASTCGAPSNPWGYNFCQRGSFVYSPASDVCSYFNCIASFYNGRGYMAQCNDGSYSMSGGIQGACSHHSGESQPVYSGSGPH